MKMVLNIILITLLNTVYAQSPLAISLEEQKDEISQKITEIVKKQSIEKDLLDVKTKSFDKSEKEIKKLKSEWADLPELQNATYNKFKNDIRRRLNASQRSIEESIKNIANYGQKKNFFKYKKFLKCLDKAFKKYKFYNKTVTSNCNKHKETAKEYEGYDSFFQDLANNESILKKSRTSINKALKAEKNKKRKISIEIEKHTRELKNLKRNFKKQTIMQDKNFAKIKEEKLSEKFKEFYTCDKSTPTLDLEEEKVSSKLEIPGPFHKIARDNQDGIGSCFANTAKNLLVGLSAGKEDASFLDMALQYKAEASGPLYKIDGGLSCKVLDEIKKNGYCPKELSSLESGDKVQSQGGIFEKETNLRSQSRVLKAMANFLKGKALLEKNPDTLSKKLLSNSNKMIKAIKDNEDIKLPYPSISQFPIEPSTLESLYIWSYKNKIDEKNKTNEVKEEIIPKEDFLNEFEAIMVPFSNEYLLATRDGLSIAKRKEIYKKHFSKFTNKFNLTERLNDTYYSGKFKKFHETNNQAELEGQYEATISFYKEFVDPKVTEKTLNNLFDSTCYKEAKQYSLYVRGLKELTDFFKKSNISTDLLYADGKSLSNKDILQLAIAPKCLNKKNRKMLDFNFSCKKIDKYKYKDMEEPEKLFSMNKKVVMSLARGLPVGNTYHTGRGWHINTIVGYRFNPETKICEYKIRESQTGTFYWKDTKNILNTLKSLTLVERDDEK